MSIQALAEEGKVEEASEKMDASPSWLQRTPGYISLRAPLLMEYGDVYEAGRLLRKLERRQPNFFPLYPSLPHGTCNSNGPVMLSKRPKKRLRRSTLMTRAGNSWKHL